MVAHPTDILETGIDLLLEQYRGKPVLEALITSYLKQVQLLIDAASDMHLARLVENATGPRLDEIGKLVGAKRTSADDNVYRLWVQAKILINKSSGTHTDFMLLAHYAGTTGKVTDIHPATIRYETQQTTSAIVLTLQRLIREGIQAAGVGLAVIYRTVSDPLLPKNVGASDVSANGLADSVSPGTLTYGKFSGVF